MPLISNQPQHADTSVAEMRLTPITADEEYKKNKDLKKEDVEALRQWMKSQPHFPVITDEQLILFLHSCYYDMENSKKCIDVYYTIRSNSPDFFNNRDFNRPELQKALKVLHFGCFPVKDPNGYQIIYHKLQQFEPSKYVFNDGVKMLGMAIDACLHVEGTVPGYVFLFDMKGVRLGHLTRFTITSMKKFFLYIQEGMPVRLKAIHVLNTHSLVEKIMIIIRPFMKKELLKMIHFHQPGEMEEVYKILPKNCLPSDYDGDLASCDELHANYTQWMVSLSDYWKSEEKYRFDEKKKPGKKNKYVDIEPDLRSLDID